MLGKTAHAERPVVCERIDPRRRDEFADDVRLGLTSHPKRLVPKYFYDALGSYLFEAICHLPNYYLTRAETEILARYAGEIVGQIADKATLVELGSGSAIKSRYLIRALLERQGALHYQPIDISAAMLASSSASLLGDFPGLRITALAGDYTQGLSQIERSPGECLMALFLGSNIGNYDPLDARALISSLRASLSEGDAMLLGADMKKSPSILEAAYDDELGLTAAFNLNLLLRINRELGGNFDLSQFEHLAFFNPEQGRVEMHLKSTTAQEVAISELGTSVHFAAGETIHTESSYKYDENELSALANETGFSVARSWFDGLGQFSCNLWFAV